MTFFDFDFVIYQTTKDTTEKKKTKAGLNGSTFF